MLLKLDLRVYTESSDSQVPIQEYMCLSEFNDLQDWTQPEPKYICVFQDHVSSKK